MIERLILRLGFKPHWRSTAKCAVSKCDSPKGLTRVLCFGWLQRHVLRSE